MTTIIYNCKRCKIGRRVEYPEMIRDRPYRRDPVTGVTYPACCYVTAFGGGKPTEYGGDPLGLCPQCGNLMSQGKLSGRFVADHVCDSRCTGARGHSCDCSCGGANHGKDWA